MSSYVRPAVAAMVVIAVAALGLAVLQSGQPADQAVEADPPEAGPLWWTPARLRQDWPAPVRPEPGVGVVIKPMRLGDDARWVGALWEPFEFADATGDVGPGVAEIDITEVLLGVGLPSFKIGLARDTPLPVADPKTRWVAYGVVLDTNGDGAADVRIGIDNLPGGEHRAWRTDLASGQTLWAAGPPYGLVGQGLDGRSGRRVALDTWYPGDDSALPDLRYWPEPGEMPFRFYAWASMIEDGRIVATDYVPDVGWLKEGAQPPVTLVGPLWTYEEELDTTLGVIHTLSFLTDGRVSITTRCHRGVGAVTVEPETFRVSDLALTQNGCAGRVAHFETSPMAILLAGEIEYSIEAGVLELRAGGDILRLSATYVGPPR